MAQVRTGYIPYGKYGAGNYGSTFGTQTVKLTDPVNDRIQGLVKSIPFPDKRSVFNIGDYGAADGASSMNFIRNLIVTLREHHGPEVQFQVIYEDQEINDFNSLFRRLHGIIPDPPSYMLELDNVYPLASGINFHKQCVPAASMHFIMTVSAVHWLSKPVIYKDSLFVLPNCTEEEKEALTKQARMDLESFLLHRSTELKCGGILLAVLSGAYIDDNNTTQFTSKMIIGMLTDVWRSFRDSGTITEQEFINTNFAGFIFHISELKSLLDDQRSLIYQSGLRLLSAELHSIKCVFHSAWKEKKEQTGVDDRQEFAKKYVAAHRNWSNNMFMSGLSGNRTQEEKQTLVDDVFGIVETNIAHRNPEEFKNDIVLSYVIISKE